MVEGGESHVWEARVTHEGGREVFTPLGEDCEPVKRKEPLFQAWEWEFILTFGTLPLLAAGMVILFDWLSR